MTGLSGYFLTARHLFPVTSNTKALHACALLPGMRYDEDGTFISSWIPALAALPSEMRHMPFSSLKGKDVEYPQPIVEFSSQIGLPPKRERNKGM